jgi:hypothetical protein
MLEKRVITLLQDRRVMPSQQFDEDDCLANVLNRVKELKESNDDLLRRIGRLKFEKSHADHIVELYSKFVKGLSIIRDSLSPSAFPSLRPFILAVVFTQKISSLRGKQAVDEIASLAVFEGRPHYSPDAMLRDISCAVKALTEDLIEMKTQNLDFNRRWRKSAQECESCKMELQTTSDMAIVTGEKLRVMNARMLEFQHDLSVLVSPEEHNLALEQLSESEVERKALEHEIHSLERELRKRDKDALKIAKQMNKLQAIAVNETAEAQLLREECDRKEHRLSEAEAMLREKNKDILALERLVHRQKEAAYVENVSINLLAVENRNLQTLITGESEFEFEPRPESTTLAGLQSGMATTINPAFLD